MIGSDVPPPPSQNFRVAQVRLSFEVIIRRLQTRAKVFLAILRPSPARLCTVYEGFFRQNVRGDDVDAVPRVVLSV
jgi:hypothetical protein